MRVAILSDIHGNPIALDAVLADIREQGGVDGYWVLGDFSAIGYDPVTVLERLSKLPNLQCTRGNTDRYTVIGESLDVLVSAIEKDPQILAKVLESVAGSGWTRGYVVAEGWWDWLAALPLELRVTLPDGTRFLGVHAAPGLDDGPGIHPDLSEAELLALVEPAEADLICVGHTHRPMERVVNGIHVINLGSVSNPVTDNLLASYVLLDARISGYQLSFRKVEYDRQAVIEAVRKVHTPAEEYIVRLMQGKKSSGLV